MYKLIRFQYRVVKKRTGSDFKPLPNMLQYFLEGDNHEPLSFWNDVPLKMQEDIITCGIQIPKEYQGKFQVNKNIPYHPFMQDTRKNLFTKQLELRYYAQFPLFNYGFVPQTWEQNVYPDENGMLGDDDPLDICDLSERIMPVGEIYRAKVLGSFCLIDQGEIDWKIFVMDESQCQKKSIKSMQDIEKRRLQSILRWFKGIKVYDGKKQNKIFYDQTVFGKEKSLQVINEAHFEWKKMKSEPAYEQIRQKYHICQ